VNPEFLDINDVLEIHEMLIDRFGGSEGLRDWGLLDSAIAQPHMSFGGRYLHEDLPMMAAAYMFHIISNHPFVDGNKRTGVSAALVFLKINGFPLDAPDPMLEVLALGIAEGQKDKSEVAAYLRIVTGYAEADDESES
jgi:death-on-curing protein